MIERLLTTAFRFFPWPVRPGLRAVGTPGTDAPVLLTGNFALTVSRVKRALRGLDAWLLVADSDGFNVWCAAAGGHLTTQDVSAALEASGVAERVDHRRVVLPQLAAAGVEIDAVEERTGWEAVWGPVYAEALPAFLRRDVTPAMRRVRFDLEQRLAMAVMWAAPLSLLALIVLPFWSRGFWPLVALIWGLSLALYGAFPLYEDWVRSGGFAGVAALWGGLTLLGVALAGAVTGRLGWPFLLRWGGLGLALALTLVFDLPGTTPLYKSWSHEEQGYRVALDEEACIACERCERVCPRGVFAVSDVAALPRIARCEQCGACVVQCPTDALCFVTPAGERIPPEKIRRYKLNLMGQREIFSC
jgi:ferredoxin